VNCEIRDEGGIGVVSLSGDVDLDSSPRVRTALLDCVRLKAGVLVDMSGVSYIDSSGVASLVEAFQSARKSQTSFGLVEVSEGAMRVLELARLDKVFSIYPSLTEGLQDAG
jgi:anti-sigma B factor antagonist